MDYIGVIQKRGILLWAREVREGEMEENELKPVLKGVGWAKMSWESFQAKEIISNL